MAAAALSLAAAEPASLDSLLPAELHSELEATGEIRRTFKQSEPLALFPALPMREAHAARVAELQPTIGVEFLVLHRVPEGVDSLAVYNALHSISSLRGIQYYSQTRGRMRVFFEDASLIDGRDGASRLADPIVEALPPAGSRERFFALLDDSSLGRYVAEVDYEIQDAYIAMSFSNTNDIRRLFVSFVAPRGLTSFVAVVPLEGSLLFYGYSCVRAVDPFGAVERKGEASFSNRMIALFSWFRDSYARHLQQR